MKNVHFWSPSDPSQTAEAKLRYVYSILKPHGQSFRRQVKLLLSEAKPTYVYSIIKPHGHSSSQTATEQGEVKLCILNIKTTWSEFQQPNLFAAMQGKAKLPILDFKTKWSEFQKPCQTSKNT